MKQLRCAIIGCGRIGCGFDDKTTKTIMTHAGSYFNNSNTKLIALCDIDQKKLKKYGKKYNINNLYTTSDEMFENETIDCVSICTLVDTHLELVTQAVKHGIKAIFLEKPISNSLHTAKKIINICNDNNVILLIDHQRRFDPFFHTLKDLIQTKKLGTIQSINIYYGSGISNTGSHIFDLIRLFFGEAVSVNARYSKNTSSNKLDPNLNIILKFKNDVECVLHALDYRQYGLLEMDILGSLGRLTLNLTSKNICYSKISTKNGVVYKTLIPSSLNIKNSKMSAIQLGIKNLVNCVLLKHKPMCTGHDGYKSLELIIASLQSANQNKIIILPLTNNKKKISSR